MEASENPILIRGAREHNLKNVSVDLPSQKLIVITGPSGSGKSSLAFDTLFAEGQRRYMESLSAYARQFMEQLSKPDVDLIDGLSPSIAIEQKTISSHPRSTVGTVTNIYDFLRLLFARMGEVRDPETGKALKAHSLEDILGYLSEKKKGEKIRLYASVVRGKKGEFLREFEQWRRAGFTKIRIDGTLHDLHDPILIPKHQHHDLDILLDSFSWDPEKSHQERVQAALALALKHAQGWLRVDCASSEQEKLFSQKIGSANSESSFPDIEPRMFSFNSPYGMCERCHGVGFIDKKKKGRKVQSEDSEEFLFDIDAQELCPSCEGARLRKESLCVFLNQKNIHALSSMPCPELIVFLKELAENSRSHKGDVTRRLVEEIVTRLEFLDKVGVGYLSLGRPTTTLSGGEAQRIRLATQLGSQLSGVLYVLDEPSIGLHPSDQEKLISSLKHLRDLGNTVVVVEHDEETILQADHIIDIGPGAGVHGGEVVAEGSPQTILNSNSITGAYLRGDKQVFPQQEPRKGNGQSIKISGCSGHNLKNVDLSLPLGKFIVVTGVSGSGKSSLIQETLEAALAKKLYRTSLTPLPFVSLEGVENIDKLVHIDQRPIGRSPRSNPATYTGLFSSLRQVFSQTPDAQIRGYVPGTFSFNVKSGRCDKCEGAGRIKVEMHFLPDVYVLCETCNGSRYRREVLEVRFKGKSIADVLNMTIEEAYEHFSNQPQIEPKLRTLKEVGLGYVTLGQSSTTLSGGEAQRVKLAKELSRRATGKTLYFLDEPTTGLHFEDVRKLLDLLHKLCDLGNTVVVIEHNLDVIASADWLIDMGPASGAEGGRVMKAGVPSAFVTQPQDSVTGRFIQNYFQSRSWAIPSSSRKK